MGRFDPVLRRVDRRLGLREPERSRLLLELAADLEALYREYRGRGMEEEEARRRAEAWLAPDPDGLDRLQALHGPLLDRLPGACSEPLRGRLQRAALATLALASMAGALWALRAADLLWPPAASGVAILALAGSGAWAAGREAWRLRAAGTPEAGPTVRPWLPAAALASVAVGGLGGVLRLQDALRTAEGAAGSTAAAAGALPWEAVAAAAGTAALGLVVALGLGLAWFGLEARAAEIRALRAELGRVGGFGEQELEGG